MILWCPFVIGPHLLPVFPSELNKNNNHLPIQNPRVENFQFQGLVFGLASYRIVFLSVVQTALSSNYRASCHTSASIFDKFSVIPNCYIIILMSQILMSVYEMDRFITVAFDSKSIFMA